MGWKSEKRSKLAAKVGTGGNGIWTQFKESVLPEDDVGQEEKSLPFRG